MVNSKPIEILLVEDSPSDAQLAIEALKEAKIANNLTHVEDGVEAMNYLRQRGKYSGVASPDLILLDLNLPRKDGREILAELKQDPVLRVVPVVVLTSSKAEEDVVKSYQLHANCYITKPVDFDQFLKVIKSIEDFWLAVVKFAPNGSRKHS